MLMMSLLLMMPMTMPTRRTWKTARVMTARTTNLSFPNADDEGDDVADDDNEDADKYDGDDSRDYDADGDATDDGEDDDDDGDG